MSPIVAFLVAVNPPVPAGAGGGRIGRRAFAWTMVAALGAVVVTAAASGPLLDLLDVSAPTFRVATAVVLGVAAVRRVVVGSGSPPGDGGSPPPLVPYLLTPQLVAVTIMVGAEEGVVTAAAVGAVALGVTGLAAAGRQPPAIAWDLAARIVGLAAVAVAVALALDGVRSV